MNIRKKRSARKSGKDKKRTGGRYIRIRLSATAILLLGSALLMILAARSANFAEWYSEHIYPIAVESIGRVCGMIPFSVSEIGIYILILALLITLIRMIVKSVHSHTLRALPGWLSGVLLAVGILAFLYTACCGINYHRKSFSEEEGIVTYEYSADELKEICIWLTEEINVRADDVGRDENGLLELEASEREGGIEAMQSLAEEFPTVCHELSHLRGFMEEQEANFIAFLACIGSERMDFQYSGYLSGWVYCMNALYRADYERWQEVRETLNAAAEPDLAANNEFCDRYEGTISRTAERINDTYLKVIGQVDGVQSYDRMVDLIVAYFGNEISE